MEDIIKNLVEKISSYDILNYRTIIAMLVVVMGAKLYDWLLYDLIDDLGVAGSNSVFLIACLLITMLFIHSYKKQTDYIRGRVEKYVKSKQIGK